MRLIILAKFFFVALVGCNDSSHLVAEGNIYRFPLLKQCQDLAIQKLDEFSSLSAYDYKIFKFDEELETHPDLVGYVELSSREISKDILASDVNSFVINCYPNSSMTVKKDEGYGEDFENAYFFKKRLGVDRSYLVDTGSEIKIYYRRDTD